MVVDGQPAMSSDVRPGGEYWSNSGTSTCFGRASRPAAASAPEVHRSGGATTNHPSTAEAPNEYPTCTDEELGASSIASRVSACAASKSEEPKSKRRVLTGRPR